MLKNRGKVNSWLKQSNWNCYQKSYRSHHSQPSGFIFPVSYCIWCFLIMWILQRFIRVLHAASQRLILEIPVNKYFNKRGRARLFLTVWSIDQQQAHPLGAHKGCPPSDHLCHTRLFNRNPKRDLHTYLHTQESLRSAGSISHALLFILIIYS